MADAKLSTVEQLLLATLRGSESSNAKILELTNAIAAVVEELDSVKADAEETEAALAQKQPILTFDPSPTIGSTNPITSGGVAKCMIEVVGDIDSILDDINDKESATVAQINELLDEINGEGA